MIYSTTCAYAIHAVARLAAIAPERYARVQDVCANSDLPQLFVSKILRDLVRAGLLKSAKGRHGGFGLAKPPQKIRLVDIVAAVDGLQAYGQCVVGLARCDDRQPCPQHDSFKPVRHEIVNYLTETTVAQMAEALVRKGELIGRPVPLEPSRAGGSGTVPKTPRRGRKATVAAES